MTDQAGPPRRPTNVWAWLLTAVSALLLLVHAFILWGFAHMFSAYLLTVLIIAGPVFSVCVTAVAVWRRPVHVKLATFNGLISVAYLVLWLPQLLVRWR